MGIAKAKGIQIDDVEIHLSFERNFAPKFHKDYHGDPNRRKNMIAKIVSDVYIKGDLSENEKDMLLEDLAHCPLHNTLAHPPELIEKIHLLQRSETMPKYD